MRASPARRRICFTPSCRSEISTMSDTPAPLSMNDLLLCVHGAAAIQLLRSGVELNVFPLLYEHRHLTLEELNAHVRIDEQSIRTLFMGLAALRLVHKQGDQYANADAIEGLRPSEIGPDAARAPERRHVEGIVVLLRVGAPSVARLVVPPRPDLLRVAVPASLADVGPVAPIERLGERLGVRLAAERLRVGFGVLLLELEELQRLPGRELLEAADAIAILPTPVVPLGRLHAGEVTFAELVAGGADDEARSCRGRELDRCAVAVLIGIFERKLSA